MVGSLWCAIVRSGSLVRAHYVTNECTYIVNWTDQIWLMLRWREKHWTLKEKCWIKLTSWKEVLGSKEMKFPSTFLKKKPQKYPSRKFRASETWAYCEIMEIRLMLLFSYLLTTKKCFFKKAVNGLFFQVFYLLWQRPLGHRQNILPSKWNIAPWKCTYCTKKASLNIA